MRLAKGANLMTRIRRVMHPSDFSRASGAAFARAVDLAKANRAELIVAHVLAPIILMMGDAYVPPRVFEDLEAAARAEGKKQLNRLLAKARRAGVRARSMLLEGIAHEQIVRAARSTHADLIVIGTHGRTGIAKMFLGSVAGRVVSSTRCPVMTVRGK